MKYVYKRNPELMEIDKKLEVLKREQKRVKAKIEEIKKQIKK